MIARMWDEWLPQHARQRNCSLVILATVEVS